MIPCLGLGSSKSSPRDKDLTEGGIRKVAPGNTSGEVSQGGEGSQ